MGDEELETGGEAVDETPPEGTEAETEEPSAEEKAQQEAEAAAAAEEEARKEANRLAYERRSAEREERRIRDAERQRQETAELVKRQVAEALEGIKKPTGTPGKPVPDQFETWEQYLDARDEWNRQEWQRENKATMERVQGQVQAAQRQAEFRTQKAEFDKSEAEYRQTLGAEGAKAYDEAVDQLSPWLVTDDGQLIDPELTGMLLRAGPKVVHELSRDLAAMDRIANADPYTRGFELGRIAARVADGGRQGRRYSPPPPPRTVSGAGGARVASPDETRGMTERDYLEWRKQQGY